MTTSDSSNSGPAGQFLPGIQSPADVKALKEQDLPQLAQEVREELIKVLSQTGGHLGPNLGVVELTIALHRVFSNADATSLSSTSAIRATCTRCLPGGSIASGRCGNTKA